MTAELSTMDDPKLARFTRAFVQADIERRQAEIDAIVSVLDKAGRTEVTNKELAQLSATLKQ